MFNARLYAILRELMVADTVVTSEYLANVIGVTSRTIRNDMKDLEDMLSQHVAVIHSVRGIGYKMQILDDSLFCKLLQEMIRNDSSQHGMIPNTPEERIRYLIKRLLLTEEFVKLEDLADELYISKSTIQNDLKDVKKALQEYGIELDKRPNYGLRIKGEEVKLRFCMSEYIFNRKETEANLLNAGIPILSNEEMTIIRTIILDQDVLEDFSLSDFEVNNLVVHLAIAVKRLQSNHIVTLHPEQIKDIIHQKEFETAIKIANCLKRNMNISVPPSEISYIAILLLGKKTIPHTYSEMEAQTSQGLGIHQLATEIMETIESKLKLGIKQDKDLFAGLCLHLKPAINRHRYGMNLRNPMLEEIKANCPIAFEAGILAAMVLNEKLGIGIDKNEAGYFALHIAAAMERKNVSTSPKRCMIVCASGMGSARFLFYKMKSVFGSKLDILGTTDYYKLKQIPLHSLDFIVSTIPIRDSLPIPHIEVNAILGSNDIQKIEKMISANKDPIFEYLREELLFLQQNLETKEEVLEFLGDKLRGLGLINETFIDSVIEREAVSSTCFGNLVAIPHPIIPQTDSTFWAICTLQKPIDWDNKRVQFVCLLSIQKNSTAELQQMYAMLINLVDETDLVQKLLKCKTYQEFITAFAKQ
ncbi:lichenan operon transcriptional antiterminator [Paenibacillus sophorae]|uniref:BglG family transcription antiterminator n=1 Tax=Paenibacillus sophorae TaxID=1333845 RepID=A0A1H8UI65_9BACL|nr:BglG family transcription antiterminator [Paenibacillus sophorae]QWU13137.1 BglG family transcription antiterminator [Paenibacillus sophorae]SEP02298.1 lichenan operon transcriptional antiterminator [Paenibacillus sophorae]